MLKTPPISEASFNQLKDALKAEIAELEAEGQHRFHVDAVPSAARPLLQDAVNRKRILDEVERIHLQWRREIPMPRPTRPEGHGPIPPSERGRAVLIRNMEGVSVPEAAKCLGITAEKVRKLLEEGTLKGFRPTGGNWKVPRSEIRDFSNRRRSQS